MIDRPKLYRAAWSGVLRLARSLRMRTPPDDCACVVCKEKLIERLVRICQ